MEIPVATQVRLMYQERGKDLCEEMQTAAMPEDLRSQYTRALKDPVALLAAGMFAAWLDGDERVATTAQALYEGYYDIDSFALNTMHNLVVYHSMSISDRYSTSDSVSVAPGSHSDPDSSSPSSKACKMASHDSPPMDASSISAAGSGSTPPL